MSDSLVHPVYRPHCHVRNEFALQNENIVNSYVLYYCSSYLHCKWATLKELEKDPRIHQKIKRFRTKQAQMKHLFTEVSSPVAAGKSVHSPDVCGDFFNQHESQQVGK